MNMIIPQLVNSLDTFVESKDKILLQWVAYEIPQKILKSHDINNEKFLNDYAGGVFDYFIDRKSVV